ncbi:hypothetical protein WMY93_011300 [Mugilogobius chulae]|uniref:Uncharacterized protein n=1 Tax=Mugilogobius chulae TaxID=88201 RepID=A0AAW0PC75_9GOBI
MTQLQRTACRNVDLFEEEVLPFRTGSVRSVTSSSYFAMEPACRKDKPKLNTTPTRGDRARHKSAQHELKQRQRAERNMQNGPKRDVLFPEEVLRQASFMNCSVVLLTNPAVSTQTRVLSHEGMLLQPSARNQPPFDLLHLKLQCSTE